MAFQGGAFAFGSLGAGSAGPVTASPAIINVGDLVVVTLDADGITSIDSVTDSLGNVYQPVSAQLAMTLAGAPGFTRSFYSLATVGGSNPTVTGTFTGTTTNYCNFPVTRYLSTLGNIRLAGSNRAQSASSPGPADSGTVTVGAHAMLYGYNDTNVGDVTQPAGWTERDATFHLVADLLAPIAGVYSYRVTLGSTEAWMSEIIAFSDGARGSLALLGVGG